MIRGFIVCCACAMAMTMAACSAIPKPVTDIVTNTFAPTPTSAGAQRRFAQLLENDAPRLQVAIVGAGVSPLVLRESMRDGIATWISADGATIALQDGFLRGTRGLGSDVLATDVDGSRAAVLARRPGTTIRKHTFLTGNDQAETLMFQCEITDQGAKSIPINDKPTDTRLMQESCVGDRDTFINFFWVRDSDNQVVQSTQWAGPDLGRVSMRVVSE